MKAFLALIAFLQAAHVPVEQVKIPGPDNTTLEAALVHPVGPPRGPAVVALHGCGGPFAQRDGPWAVALAEGGHAVLLPDSFGSRGLGSQCKVKQRTVKPVPTRRADAIAAAQWLAAQPGTLPGGVVLMGWSNGGSTVMWTDDAADPPPPGLFRRFVAFYPGCRSEAASQTWRPAGPIMILAGANDDWTPAAPCRTLAARFPDLIRLTLYPDAWHDFDALDRPVVARSGLATPPSGTGIAHAGTNPEARADAFRRVPAFIDGD
ncbi:MAG TPA: dienelactone hydrolase family protein [Acetobacteraceae bacterium]|nr:dienelactone hydrolase family protein [Acetobacteraceae bacterium]